jgi:hypothetical protein
LSPFHNLCLRLRRVHAVPLPAACSPGLFTAVSSVWGSQSRAVCQHAVAATSSLTRLVSSVVSAAAAAAAAVTVSRSGGTAGSSPR